MKKWILFAATLCLVFVIAACGSANKNNETGSTNTGTNNGSTNAGSTGGEVVIKAKNWEFAEKEYKIKAGEPVQIKLESTEGVHGIEISNSKVKIANNATQTVTLDAGEYEIKCNVPCGTGHAQMKTKLTVE